MLVLGQVNLSINGGKGMAEVMTDRQLRTILEMVDMILDGCRDLGEAKKKVKKLIESQSGKEKAE